LFDDSHQKLSRLGQPIARPPGSPTPCWKCPKQNPEHARTLERDFEKISLAVERYFRTRGTSGGCLTAAERSDSLVARAAAIIDSLVRCAELDHVARGVCNLLTRQGGA